MFPKTSGLNGVFEVIVVDRQISGKKNHGAYLPRTVKLTMRQLHLVLYYYKQKQEIMNIFFFESIESAKSQGKTHTISQPCPWAKEKGHSHHDKLLVVRLIIFYCIFSYVAIREPSYETQAQLAPHALNKFFVHG